MRVTQGLGVLHIKKLKTYFALFIFLDFLTVCIVACSYLLKKRLDLESFYTMDKILDKVANIFYKAVCSVSNIVA